MGNVHLFDRIDVFEAWKDRNVSGLPKSNKPRSIPIPEFLSEAIQSYLEDRVRTNPDDLLFCEELTGNRRSECWWRKNYYKALKQGEIAVFDARGRKRQPHSLRHTLNTLLLDQGCNPLKVQFYLGWGPSSKVPVLTTVQRGYTHFAVEELRELIPVIERILQLS